MAEQLRIPKTSLGAATKTNAGGWPTAIARREWPSLRSCVIAPGNSSQSKVGNFGKVGLAGLTPFDLFPNLTEMWPKDKDSPLPNLDCFPKKEEQERRKASGKELDEMALNSIRDINQRAIQEAGGKQGDLFRKY